MAASPRRKKSDAIYRSLLATLRSTAAPGERFLTVRALADRHGVSLQTAHNLVQRLRASGVLEQRPHGVSYVKSIPCRTPPYRVAVLVPRHAGWFRERFIDGFCAGFGPLVPAGSLIELDTAEASTSACVDRVAALQVDGVIGVSGNYGWPFYALHRLGLPVLADLVSPQWPSMPVTSVDFSATAEAAGVMLRRHGHRCACIVGTWHAGANRPAFARGLARQSGVLTADVHGPEASQELRALLHTARPTAVYVVDNGAIPIVLTMLAGEGVRIPQDISVVMHDGNAEPYDGFTIPRIASVGPSIQEIGKALAQRMCRMLAAAPADEPALQYLQPVVRVSGSVRRV